MLSRTRLTVLRNTGVISALLPACPGMLLLPRLFEAYRSQKTSASEIIFHGSKEPEAVKPNCGTEAKSRSVVMCKFLSRKLQRRFFKKWFGRK